MQSGGDYYYDLTMTEKLTLPDEYRGADGQELSARIAARKEELDRRLCILGHHYQRDEVIQFADFTGDSLKLSRQAAEADAEYIVFCGVHFMAESAAILAREGQVVCLPNLRAGCAMAEMAEAVDVAAAIDEVAAATDEKVVPITYVNSTAETKAATARADGACCTSSNARRLFEWALKPESDGGGGGDKIFAIPDQHLGRNIAVEMGYSPQDCILYDPHEPNGGLAAEDIRRAKFILWKGHCYVHQIFMPDDVVRVRREHPGITVMVHPESPREVVELADRSGSTEQIIKAVAESPSGSKWAIGTEANLVYRLDKRHGDKDIMLLSARPAMCYQMATIDLPHLLWSLDSIAEGAPVNQITVSPEIATDARKAVERMISI